MKNLQVESNVLTLLGNGKNLEVENIIRFRCHWNNLKREKIFSKSYVQKKCYVITFGQS